MAFLLSVDWQDAQGEDSTTSQWLVDEGDAQDVLDALKAASNAKITAARISTPVPLTTITDNTASAANVETVKTKAKVKFRGADVGSTGKPFAYVTIGIPAPKGDLINSKYGDVTNAELQSLKVKIQSESGVSMDTVESITYGR